MGTNNMAESPGKASEIGRNYGAAGRFALRTAEALGPRLAVAPVTGAILSDGLNFSLAALHSQLHDVCHTIPLVSLVAFRGSQTKADY
jgi:hypothetical protein